MEKFVERTLLYDFYGEHLVEKFVNIRGQVQKIHELASGYHADDIEAISNVILEEL